MNCCLVTGRLSSSHQLIFAFELKRITTSTARECPGAPKCPQGEDCFAEAARRRAAAADVIVVNTHLYATHAATDGYLLPARACHHQRRAGDPRGG